MMIGERWTWKQEPRGGYGYVIPVPVVITRIGSKRVQVEAPLKTGGSRLVWVDSGSLVKQEKEG
jgi:hypothetical protein